MLSDIINYATDNNAKMRLTHDVPANYTPPPALNSNVLMNQGLLVFGEAFVEYQPLMGPIAHLFGYAARSGPNAGGRGFFTDATVI